MIARFAAAIADPALPPPVDTIVARGDLASRFAVYRNNAWVARLGLIADPQSAPPRPLYLKAPETTPQDKARLPRR